MALALLAALAALARFTMGAGRPTWLVMILLAGFALRILLTPGVRNSGGDFKDARDIGGVREYGDARDSQNTRDSRYDSESGK
jgi:hypothetical protein